MSVMFGLVILLLLQCGQGVFAAEPTDFLTKTTNGTIYFETGINLTGADYFVFQVKATKAFTVAIVKTPGVYNESMFEFGFAETDTYVTIRNRTSSSNLALGYKGGLLENGTKFIQLWMSWKNGIITAGTGEVIGLHTMVTYLPMPPLTSINTVAINSKSYTANWIIPYDQVTNVTVIDETSFFASDQPYGSEGCGARWFKGSVPLPVNLVGKEAIVLQLNFTSVLANVRFFTTTGYYYNFQLTSSSFYISSSNASTVLGMGTNNDRILSRTYWFAWKSGVALMGIGSVVGRNAVASYDSGGPIVVTSMSTTGLNEIFVPLYYLTGINATNGNRSNSYNAEIYEKEQYIGACPSVCMLLTVPNPTCMPSYCALSCLNQPFCPSFCFRQLAGVGGGCSCDLYDWSDTSPPPLNIYTAAPGSSFWAVI